MSGSALANNECPICGVSLETFDLVSANHHVNKCLDTGGAPAEPPGKRLKRKQGSQPKAVAPPASVGTWRVDGYIYSCTLFEEDAETIPLNSFSVATLNVWFEDYYLRTRFCAQFSYFEKTLPTFILLQEVTPAYWNALLKLDWVAKNYYVIGERPASYGVCILSRVKPTQAQSHRLSTIMDRNVLTMVCPNGLLIGTTHLESTDAFRESRMAQLRQLNSILRNQPECVVGGDFNYCGNGDPEKKLEPEYLADAVTDGRSTIGVNYPSNKWKSKRFDRVLYCSSKYSVSSVEHFGDEKLQVLPQDKRSVAPGWVKARGAYMSDHLGVLVHFKITADVLKTNSAAVGVHPDEMRKKRLARFAK